MARVHILAVSNGSARERLIDAYAEASSAKTDGLPERISKRIEALHKRITRVEPKGEEGAIAATVNAMTYEEAVERAVEIVCRSRGT